MGFPADEGFSGFQGGVAGCPGALKEEEQTREKTRVGVWSTAALPVAAGEQPPQAHQESVESDSEISL